jgi:hypothetical protein
LEARTRAASNRRLADGARLSSELAGNSLPCCQFVAAWCAPVDIR